MSHKRADTYPPIILGAIGMLGIIVLATSVVYSVVYEEVYVDAGTLYKEVRLLPDLKMATNVSSLAGFAASHVLYITASNSNDKSLMLMNVKTGTLTKIASRVASAALSHDAAHVVYGTADTHEVYLVSVGTMNVRAVGVYGSNPVFSEDGNHVVYEKVLDPSTGLIGKVRYNILSGTEVLVTDEI